MGKILYGNILCIISVLSWFIVLDPPLILGIDKVLDFNLRDAGYIDTIHTSELTKGKKIGHVDFYVNPESRPQPNCDWFIFTVSSGDACSHSFAHIIFKESITNFTPFTAKKCTQDKDGKTDWGKCFCPTEHYVYMGYYRNLAVVSGAYLVETKRQAPFANNTCSWWGNGD